MVGATRSEKRYTLTVITTALILLGSLIGERTVAVAEEVPEDAPYHRHMRTIETLGVPSPTGLAFSPAANAFLIFAQQDAGHGSVEVTLISPFEDHVGSVRMATAIPEALNAAFDRRGNRLLYFDPAANELAQVSADATGKPTVAADGIRRFDARQYRLRKPQGMAVDPSSGNVYLLDTDPTRIVRIVPDPQHGLDSPAVIREGRYKQIDLKLLGWGQPRGLGYNPQDGRLYVLLVRANEQLLVEIAEDGQLASTRDLTPLSLRDPRGLVFAPSGDPTDDATNMHLYLLDGGRGGGRPANTGRIVELSLSEPTLAASDVPVVGAALVQTIHTSQWSPPSPDPSGMAYWPSLGRFLVVDGEVEEMPNYFQGKNVYEAATTGSLVLTCSTTTFTKEPVGVAVDDSNGHVFISDDSKKIVFEVNPGPDRSYCTADDTVTSFSTAAFGSQDPEGLAFGQRQLFVADGTGREIYVVNPGPNGIFDGVSPTGDDIVTSFDTSTLGPQDPEGVEFNPNTDTLYIASREVGDNLVETTTAGTVVRVVDISFLDAQSTGSVISAPGTNDPAMMHPYLGDRGVDNNDDPNENDGKVFELAIQENQPPANRLGNPGFEFDADNNSFPDRWNTNVRFIRSNEVVRSGSFAGKHSGADGLDYTLTQIVNYLTPGTTYTFAGWVNIPATTDAFTFRLEVQWRDSSNTTLRTDRVKTYTAPTNGWNEANASFVAPAGTTSAKVRMVVKSLNATIYVDDFVFAPLPSASATPTPTPTGTATPIATPTPTPIASATPTANPTTTPTPTSTAAFTATPTTTPTLTAIATPASLTFRAEADSYVEEANPTTNFGTANQLLVDGSPNRQAYLRFVVTGVDGAMRGAKLRLFAFNPTPDGPAIYATGSAWTETGITWSNKPAPIGTPSDNAGSISKNTWVEFDVTPLVTGNGTYSFVIIPDSGNGVDFYSRTGGQPPQLLLTVGED